jgi:hypothetical protein
MPKAHLTQDWKWACQDHAVGPNLIRFSVGEGFGDLLLEPPFGEYLLAKSDSDVCNAEAMNKKARRFSTLSLTLSLPFIAHSRFHINRPLGRPALCRGILLSSLAATVLAGSRFYKSGHARLPASLKWPSLQFKILSEGLYCREEKLVCNTVLACSEIHCEASCTQGHIGPYQS